MIFAIVLLAVGTLAYANGANDNFKGVATLFGSGTTHYRGALAWATLTTLLGSLAAVFLAEKLLHAFKGKGLVDATLVAEPTYVAAVALATAITVLIATRIGMPVSTTHGLIGALIGAGIAAGSVIHTDTLVEKLLAPLLISPVVALSVTAIIYPILRSLRKRFGIVEQTCLCVGPEIVEILPLATPETVLLERTDHWTVSTGTSATCKRRYAGRVLGLEASVLLDRLHYLSAGMLSFARGLNDTPKIAALLLVIPVFSGTLAGAGSSGWSGSSKWGSFLAAAAVGLIIALGGWLSARRVAETMSHKITSLNHGQGFTANAIAGLIIIGASRFGMPVSTTHVSCGALFGIGSAAGSARWKTIATILAAWVTTLPMGALLGAAGYWVFQSCAA